MIGRPLTTPSAPVLRPQVRPLNERERDEGHRVCVSFDDPTKQVVLTVSLRRGAGVNVGRLL
jgi:hypothetical protein